MIKSNDYILITDYNDDYYLRVGKVLEVIYDYDNEPTHFTVEFEFMHKPTQSADGFVTYDEIYAISHTDRIKEYKYDLPEKCKVLMFRE